MRFMVMVKADADYEAGTPPNPALIEAIAKLSEESMRTGVLVATGGLLPSSCGARVTLKGGKLSVVDGPFSEAKELIGGYAIINADSKSEAIRMAEQFLKVHADVLGPTYHGECEVRQMFEEGEGCAGTAVEASRAITA